MAAAYWPSIHGEAKRPTLLRQTLRRGASLHDPELAQAEGISWTRFHLQPNALPTLFLPGIQASEKCTLNGLYLLLTFVAVRWNTRQLSARENTVCNILRSRGYKFCCMDGVISIQICSMYVFMLTTQHRT